MDTLDRRVVRTRNLLQDALLSLILEQGYDSIRVQDITEVANLGRATFYVHYPDKEALLLAIIERTRDDLIDNMQASPQEGTLPGFRAQFQHAIDHPTFYKVVLNHVGGRQYIANVMIDVVVDAMRRQRVKVEPPIEFMVNFIVGAVLQVLDWWLENDMPYSIEEMESMFAKIVNQGLSSLGLFDSQK